jgi:hypothetical protein
MYLITGKIVFENGQGNIVDENGNEAMEVNPHNTEILSNFTQYSGKQPLDLDMGDPELSDRMEQLEKTVKANINPENKYADYSDNQKSCLSITWNLSFSVLQSQLEKQRLMFVLPRIELRDLKKILIGKFLKNKRTKLMGKKANFVSALTGPLNLGDSSLHLTVVYRLWLDITINPCLVKSSAFLQMVDL